MKQKIKIGTITAVVIVGLLIASAFVSAAVRTTTSPSFSEKKKGNNNGPLGMMCGDTNFNQDIEIGDIIWLINYLFKGGLEPKPMLCVGDANGSNVVDVGDIIFLINYLFKGGSAPGGCCA